MTLDNFLAGINLLRKYTEYKYPLHGEHDEISFLIDEAPSAADIFQLEKLGWVRSTEYGDDNVWKAFT